MNNTLITAIASVTVALLSELKTAKSRIIMLFAIVILFALGYFAYNFNLEQAIEINDKQTFATKVEVTELLIRFYQQYGLNPESEKERYLDVFLADRQSGSIELVKSLNYLTRKPLFMTRGESLIIKSTALKNTLFSNQCLHRDFTVKNFGEITFYSRYSENHAFIPLSDKKDDVIGFIVFSTDLTSEVIKQACLDMKTFLTPVEDRMREIVQHSKE